MRGASVTFITQTFFLGSFELTASVKNKINKNNSPLPVLFPM